MNNIIECLRLVHNRTEQLRVEARTISRFAALDFTPFRFMRAGEVPTTHLLKFFLDADETHGQGDTFLQLFIAALYRQDEDNRLPRLPIGRWRVQSEKRYHEVGQIDLLLVHENKQFAICIENKPRDTTPDQNQQLARYQRHIEQHAGSLLLYLSRTKRPPALHSISKEDLDALEQKGRYLNITYERFLLPLLDTWREHTQPESIRLFIRQFRYHLEEWLGLENTKPFTLMQDQNVAELLSKSAEQIAAAFQIAKSLSHLQGLLFTKFITEFTARFQHRAADLTGGSHWEWKGFEDKHIDVPFLIRPEPITDEQGQRRYPWGRYAVGVEWTDGPALLYGVRFDSGRQDEYDKENATWSEVTKMAFSEPGRMPEPSQGANGWWPWSASIDLSNPTARAIGESTGELLTNITEKLDAVISVMRELAAQNLLQEAPAE